MLCERSWITRKTETIAKKGLAYFLPHMSAALGSFIALQSEAGLWFAIEAEYRPKGSWNGYNLAIMSWLWMDECSHYHTVIVFDRSVCVWLSWILLQWLSEGTWLFLLFTWVVKEKYRLLKPSFFFGTRRALMCAHTQITPPEGNYIWLVRQRASKP